MQKSFFVLAICLFSTTVFASTHEVKEKVTKTEKVALKFPLAAKSLNEPKNVFGTVTLQLSCATVTFTGEKGDLVTKYILEGYTAELVALFDWFACQGGYSQLQPQECYA